MISSKFCLLLWTAEYSSRLVTCTEQKVISKRRQNYCMSTLQYLFWFGLVWVGLVPFDIGLDRFGSRNLDPRPCLRHYYFSTPTHCNKSGGSVIFRGGRWGKPIKKTPNIANKSLANAKRPCGCSVLCLRPKSSLCSTAAVRMVRTTGALLFFSLSLTVETS